MRIGLIEEKIYFFHPTRGDKKISQDVVKNVFNLQIFRHAQHIRVESSIKEPYKMVRS